MSIEAMKQALEALESAQDNLRPHGDNCFLHDEGEYNRCFCGKDSLSDFLQEQVESLSQAIEQAQKQEPVAWVNWCAATGKRSVSFECESELASQPLYTTPQPQQAEKQELVSIKKVAEEHGINLPTEFVPKRDESKASIQSLANQCAALVWERDELQKQVWRYEKQKPTSPPPHREWVGLTGFEQKELMAMSAREAVFATEAKLKDKNT